MEGNIVALHSVANNTHDSIMNRLEIDAKSKKPIKTIDNFLTVMRFDPMYDKVFFNLMTNRPEVHGDPITNWTDTDTAESERYIQSVYKLHNVDMHSKALRLLFREREYNPLKNLVDGLKWDGYARIETCLHDVMQVRDTAYSREVSRLAFAGGINRLYQPGCKVDAIPILIGPQGSGKTTFCELLALNDRFYGLTQNLSGDQKSIEALEGLWIVEISELVAFKKSDVESMKSFTTSRFDRYRLPFDRNVSTLPRRCIFIGSTNDERFLTDATGNRRFFPVRVCSDGYDLLRNKDAIREYIAQCWAEARERYKAGDMSPVPNMNLREEFQREQEKAAVEDWRVGVIERYIDDLPAESLICTKEIFTQALYRDSNRDQGKRDSIEIGRILDKLSCLTKLEQRAYTEKYGQQWCWKKKSG